jgi:hypothetical protein
MEKMTMMAMCELACACKPECRWCCGCAATSQRTQRHTDDSGPHASVDRLKSSLIAISKAYIHLYS